MKTLSAGLHSKRGFISSRENNRNNPQGWDSFFSFSSHNAAMFRAAAHHSFPCRSHNTTLSPYNLQYDKRISEKSSWYIMWYQWYHSNLCPNAFFVKRARCTLHFHSTGGSHKSYYLPRMGSAWALLHEPPVTEVITEHRYPGPDF